MNYIFKSEESACFKYKYEFYFFLERINIMKFDFDESSRMTSTSGYFLRSNEVIIMLREGFKVFGSIPFLTCICPFVSVQPNQMAVLQIPS